jgi:hypothetical protein
VQEYVQALNSDPHIHHAYLQEKQAKLGGEGGCGCVGTHLRQPLAEPFFGAAPEIESVAASGVENEVVRGCCQYFCDPVQEGRGHARSCKRRRAATAADVSPGSQERRSCGCRRLMYPLRNVERVTAWTEEPLPSRCSATPQSRTVHGAWVECSGPTVS